MWTSPPSLYLIAQAAVLILLGYRFVLPNIKYQTSCGQISHFLKQSQVWRGALLLSDFLLAKPELVEGKKVLELAAGTGLTSIVAATLAESVTATDVDRGEILPLMKKNADLNKGILARPENFSVRELDFFWENWPPDLDERVTSSEVARLLPILD